MAEHTNDIAPRSDAEYAQEDFITVRDLFLWALSKWYWFAVMLVVSVAVVLFYLLVTEPVYSRYSELLIKEEGNGQSISSDMSATFNDLGLFSSNLNVNNEIIALKSPAVMVEVVTRLRLDHSYSVMRVLRRETLYGKTLPLSVSFLGPELSDFVSADVTLKADGSIRLSDFVLNNDNFSKEVVCRLADTVATPVGRVVVTKGLAYDEFLKEDAGNPITVSRSSRFRAVDRFTSALSVVLSEKESSVVNLSIEDCSIQRAQDILSTVVAVYNEQWVKDKNRVAAQTSMFIDERLRLIESELSMADEDISQFKSDNKLPDIQAAASMYMQQFSVNSAEIISLNSQLQMARYVKQYLTADGESALLPSNSGIESAAVEKQISEYNTLWLQRSNLIANSGERNPLVADLTKSLDAMRGAILSSVDNLIATIGLQIDNLERNETKTMDRLSDNPVQAKYLLSVERRQKVKEALYIYLLQKREENELSRTFTAYNTRVITPPYGNDIPVEPRKAMLLLVAFVVAFIVPLAIYVIMRYMDTAIRGKKDLEALSAPFIGEIPLLPAKKRKDKEPYKIVVRDKSGGDIINEAFRVVRTNIEFVLGKENHKVLMTTSFNPGSGKTFTTANLAVSLAIKGKRVILVDLDMRRASLSEYVSSPKTGVSNYLSGFEENLDSVICRGALHENLDVIPVGSIPPNPTELLFNERFQEMINDLRTLYDYILIDCPPIEIVADAAIINRFVDMTLFIVRVGVLERSMIRELERIYVEQKYKHIGVLLNGVDDKGRYGYKTGYYTGKYYYKS